MMNEKEGALEVWWIKNPPNSGKRYPAPSVKDAIVRLQILTDIDLSDASVYSNAGGLEVFRDGEWEEWYDDDGNDVRHYEINKELQDKLC